MTGEMTRDGARAGARARARRIIAASLVFTMLTSAVTVQAQVGSLTLPDTPLIPRPVKPTVMFTFDNSHTMNYPWVSNLLLPQGGTRREQPDSALPMANGTTVRRLSTGLAIANDPSIYSSSVNLLYYNPEIRYLPGLDPDGKLMPSAGAGVYSPTFMPNEPYRQRFGGGASGPDAASTDLTSYCVASISQVGYPGGAIALTALDHVRPTNRLFPWASVGRLSATGPDATLTASVGPIDSRPGRASNITSIRKNDGLESGTYCVWNVDRDNAPGLSPSLGIGRPEGPQVAMYAFYYRHDPTLSECLWVPPDQKIRDPNCYSRVDILHPKTYGAAYSSASFSRGSARIDCDIASAGPNVRTCSYEQEIRNFANWWSYHRTRSLAMKTALGRAIHQLPLDAPFRVGLNTVVDPATYDFNEAITPVLGTLQWLDPADWGVDQRKRFLTALYAAGSSLYNSSPGAKEVVRASVKVGKYLASGAADPYSCSGSMHLILSDGASVDPRSQDLIALDSNRPYAGPSDADYDRETDNANPDVDRSIGAVDVRGKRGALSDAAMFFYSKQLLSSNAGASDPFASFRRVQTSVIGVGFEGFKRNATSPDDISSLAQIAAGTDFWDPLVLSGYVMPQDAARSSAFGLFPWKSAVDDYWHAAINGRGVYHNAPTSDLTAWSRALPSVLSAMQSAQSLSKSGSTITQLDVTGAVFAYAATYSPGVWSGDVMRRRVNTVRGDDFASLNEYNAGSLMYGKSFGAWSARQLLDAQSAGDGWDWSRRIFTPPYSTNPDYIANVALPFRWASLNSNQKRRIIRSARWDAWPADRKAQFGNSDLAMGQAVVEFLRGKRDDEVGRGGRSVFRNRASVLGSIVNAGVAYVAAPAGRSTDVGYADFKEAQKNRGAMVYAGANDGMLHAFDAVTGRERWAFMPAAAFQNHDVEPRDSGIGSQSIAEADTLTYRPYTYVDSTPVVADVDMACAGSPCPSSATMSYQPRWRTILAGGLGKGGRSVYALDVTEGNRDDNLPESELAKSRFLWEFTESRMGFTFGEPIVAKTARWGWVVMVPTGYNATQGGTSIFVLNALTGSGVAKLQADASGLAKIAGYSSKLGNQEVDSIYGGDLQGNVWRWDLNGNGEGVRIATLTDPGGKPQPITTRPRVEVDDKGQRYVFVGTGKLLEEADVGKTDIQTMYAIRDGDRHSPALYAPVTRGSLSEVATTNVTGLSVSGSNSAGWRMDLERGEQILMDPHFAFGSIFFVGSNMHRADPCAGGASTKLYGRSAADSKTVLVEGATALTPLGTLTASIRLPTGASKIDALVVNNARSLRVTDSRGIGMQVRITPSLSTPNRGRVGWREVAGY